MIWKLVAINLLAFVLSTFSTSRLRANLNRFAADDDNTLTYLCTKNSVSFFYQFAWIVVYVISIYMGSMTLYTCAVVILRFSVLVSLFRLLAHCLPGKRISILSESGETHGYGHLIFTLLLVFLSRVLSCLAIANAL